jgi:hypothetical protein
MYLILFSAHKNRDNKANTHLSLPIESTAERNKGWASIEGSEWCRGGTKKLVSCWGRNQFAEEQTVMATDDWRASVGG